MPSEKRPPKEPYAPPKILATYGKDELASLMHPHGQSGGGCGCGCGCGCGA